MPIYKVNDKTYDIPEDKVSGFESRYPDAVVGVYDSETGKGYDIPVSKVGRFKKRFPKWTYSLPEKDSPAGNGGTEDTGNAVDTSGTDVPGATKTATPGWKPTSLQQWLRMEEIRSGIDNTISGMRVTADKTRRLVKSMTDEGRKKRKDAEMAAHMAGTPTKVIGITPGTAPDTQDSNGSSSQNPNSPAVYGVKYEDGVAKTEWMLPDGSLSTSLADADKAEYGARGVRLRHEFIRRMEENGLDPTKEDDIAQQREKDLLDSAEKKTRARLAENEKNIRSLYDERGKKLDEQREWRDDEGFWPNFVRIVGGAANRSVTANAPRPKQSMTDEENSIGTYLTENQVLTDAKKLLETRKLDKSDGFMGGFWKIGNNWRNMKMGARHALSDADLYTGGVMALQKATQLMDVEEKLKHGADLTDAEVSLVYSTMLGQDVRDNIETPHGYNAAQITIEMFPFMAQMVLNPASGLSRALVTKYGKSGLRKIAMKKAAQGLTGEAAESFAKRETRKLAAKTIGVQVAGDLAEASVLANTLQAPKTAADAIERYQGDVVEDEKGDLSFAGNHNLGEAIYKAETSAIIENYTEMLGEHLGIIGNAIGKGVGKGLRAVGGGKMVDAVSDMIGKIGSNEWIKTIGEVEKRAHWNGTVGEVLEEEAGIVLNSIFTGDNKISDLWDADQQIDIVLGVGLFGGFVSGLKTVGYPVAKAKAKGNLRKSNSIGSWRFGEDWGEIRSQIENADEKDLGIVIRDLVRTHAKSDEQGKAIVDYAHSLMKARGYEIASATARAEVTSTPEQQDIEESFEHGEQLAESEDTQAMNDAKRMLDLQRGRIASALSEDLVQDFDNDPIGALSVTHDPELRGIAADYVNAKAVYDGMIQRVRDDVDGRIAQSNAMIDSRINRETGMIQPATMKADDRRVYIVNGTVAMFEDGTGVDTNNSSESIIIRDAETGKVEFADPTQFHSVDEAVDAETEKEAARAQIIDEIAVAAANNIDGILSFTPGESYSVLDLDGNPEDIAILGQPTDENGIPLDGYVDIQYPDGTIQSVATSDLQQWVDAANTRRVEQFDNERQAQRAAEDEAARQADQSGLTNPNRRTDLMPDDYKTPYDNRPVRATRYIESENGTGGTLYQDENGNDAVVIAAIDDNNYVGYFHEYDEQGNPTNRWSAKFKNGSGIRENHRDMMLTAQELLPAGHELTEHTSVSTDGLRNLANQLKHGYELQYDEQGNIVTTEVAVNMMARDNTLGLSDYEPGSIDPARVSSEEYKEAASRLIPYMEALGLSKFNIHWEDGTMYVDHPILKRADTPQQEVQPVVTEIAETVPNSAENTEIPKENRDFGTENVPKTENSVENVQQTADDGFIPIDPELINSRTDENGNIIWDEPQQEQSWSEEPKQSALSRVPLNENGKPDFGAVDADTAWDAIVEKTSNEAMAQSFAENMVAASEAELKKAEKVKTKPTTDIDEFIAADTERIANIDRAKTALDHWKKVAGTKQRRQAEADAIRESEIRKQAEEARMKTEQERADQEEAERTEREEVAALKKIDKTYADVHAEVKEYPEAVERLKQQQPEDILEAAALALSINKLLWGDKAGSKGVASETGFKEGERKGLFSMFASKEKGGKSIARLAEDEMKQICDANGIPYNNSAARDALIEIISQSRIPSDITRFIRRRRIDQAREIAEGEQRREREAFEEWTQENYHMTADDYEAYHENVRTELANDHENFDFDDFYGTLADELIKHKINQNEILHERGDQGYGSQGEGQGFSGGSQILSSPQSGTSQRNEEDGGRPGFLSQNGDNLLYPGGTLDQATSESSGRINDSSEREGSVIHVEGISSIGERISEAESVVNTSPTEAQKKAGNYKKGHVQVGTFDVTIENPKGSKRSGTDADGKKWETTMTHTYGYIRGTKGVDGDHIDVYVSSDVDAWGKSSLRSDHSQETGDAGQRVFVVDQYNPDGSFDEHKVMLGFNDRDEAFEAYLSNYEAGWEKGRRLDVTAVNLDDFEKWIESSKRKTKAFTEYAGVKVICPVCGKAGIPNYHNHDVVCPQCNSDLSVFRQIDQLSENEKQELSDKFIGEDNQGNPIDHAGKLIVEDVTSIDDITDEDFVNPTRTIGLPKLPNAVSDAIGSKDKRVIIKKNIFGKNHKNHKELTPSQSREILRTALYTPSLYGRNQKLTRPYNWILIHLADKSTCVLLEVDNSKENCEIVNWHYLSGETLERKKRQAIKEGGRILTLSENNVAADTHDGLPSDDKGNTLSTDKQTESAESSDGYTIESRKDTRDNSDIFAVKFEERVSREVFKGQKAIAKKHGGYWSNFGKKGFLFKTREDAEAFANEVMGKPNEAVAEDAPVNLSDIESAIKPAEAEISLPADKPTDAEAKPEKKPSKWVDEEDAEEFERLRKILRNGLGQLNSGFPPELLYAGGKMSYLMMKHGVRKFAEYATAMIEELGDAIRPHLKSLYNFTRSTEEVMDSEWADELTPFDEVMKFDTANFGKPHVNAMATAENVVAEEASQQHIDEAEKKLKVERNVRINPDGSTTETINERGSEIEVTSGDFIPGVRKNNGKSEWIGKSEESKKKKSQKKSVSLQNEQPGLFGGLFDEDVTPTGNDIRRNDAVSTERLPSNNRGQSEGDRENPGAQSKRTRQGGERTDRAGEESGAERTRTVRPRLSRLTEGGRRNQRNNRAERGTDYAPKSEDARIKANIAAIELAQRLTESGDQATPEQMEVLRKFSGWGGLGKAFSNEAYAERIRKLLGDSYQDAVDSRKSAYYTPPAIIDSLWDIAKAMGFQGGTVLEGSAGIGNILGLMPEEISERSNIHAVEVDSTTGSILSLLYPDAQVEIQGFEETRIENGSVDLAITNVPFITGWNVIDKTGDKDLSKKFKDIHDFCIAKNIRKLREGGIGIFITSSGTLDNSAKLRAWVTNEGNSDVVGAFRLHNETFGGTGATSDIIVVRKRVNGKKSAHAIDVSEVSGVRTAEYDTGETKKIKVDGHKQEVPVVDTVTMDYNRYFVEHPEQMAGEMYFGFEKGDTYRAKSKALYPVKGKNQETMLSEWAQSFSGMDFDAAPTDRQEYETTYDTVGNEVKVGSMIIDDRGRLCVNSGGVARPLMSARKNKQDTRTDDELIAMFNSKKIKGRTRQQCLKDYNAIKKALADVLEYQTTHEDNDGLEPLLTKLNAAFDSFVSRYGNLHKNNQLAWLRNDVDYPGILALETYEERGDESGNRVKKFGKTDIFSRRVVEKETIPQPKNIKDGIITSLYISGRIDVGYIAGQLGISEEQVRRDIISSGLGYENPVSREMEVSYEYLSGNVREKLRQAEANNVDGRYNINIKALEKVVPINIPAHLIEFALGSSWIDPKLYEDYIKERTGLNVKLTNVGGTWFMKSPDTGLNTEQNRSQGVYSEELKKTVFGHEILEAAITNRSISVSRTYRKSDGTNETITDRDATQAVAAKVDEFRLDFKDWARAKMQGDMEMSVRMETVYNDRFNNSVPRSIPDEFIPKHFGGQVSEMGGKPFSLRPHQAKAVIRGTIQSQLLAHEVGTGKTFTLISTAMEMRRLGTARKPMIVVQNATVGQFVESAKALYPNAKVLTLEDADRNAQGRKDFYAKIRYNDWDMIVIPQSVLDMIPDSEERQIRFIQDKIAEKMLVLQQMAEQDPDGSSWITKQAEKEISDLENDLAKITESLESKRKDKSEKDMKKEAQTRHNAEVRAMEMLDRTTDDVENFDQMGIDALLVDEAHEYKHLGFATAMQRGVKGVDPSYSKKAQGLYLKTQAVMERNKGRNVIFATGTPISNTAAEIWTFMRYLMPEDEMRDYGIYYFDDFVRNFGNIQQMLEFGTNGKFKENNRFAGYFNLPELVRIWSTVTDTVLTKEAGGVSDKIPEMEGGKAQDIYLPQTKALRSVMLYVKSELDRYDKMTGKEKKANSHIPLTMYGIAKAAAVDARLVYSDAADEPQSKTNEAVRQTLRSLEETSDYKGTVAIFADNYQNKESGFNLYEDIRRKLIEQGVPAEQIVVMKSGMTVKKKLEIFDKVNAGEVRVILGSTYTLGTGVNIQERLHTLIHLDAPNRPMDYTQRNGRILRQGNLHKDMGIPVRVLRFGVEDSLDVTAYQRLKTKGAIADSIMNGSKMMENSMEIRSLEEDEDVFGDITAQLSGSEYAMLKNQAEKEVRKLNSKLKQWEADQTYIHNQIPRLKGQIRESEKHQQIAQENLDIVRKIFPDGTFKTITIGKQTFSDLESMNKLFTEHNKSVMNVSDQIRDNKITGPQTRKLTIDIDGLTFEVTTVIDKEIGNNGGNLFSKASRKITYSCPELQGVVDIPVSGARLKGAVEDIVSNLITGKDYAERVESMQSAIDRNQSELQQIEQRKGNEFEFYKELEDAKTRLEEYTEKMKAELAEKEAKYADMDAGVEAASEISLTEEDTEETEEDDGNVRYRLDEDPGNLVSGIEKVSQETRRSVTDYISSYPSSPISIIGNITDLDTDGLTPEEVELLKDFTDNDTAGDAFYYSGTGKIYIFANRLQGEDWTDVIHHENTHGVIDRWRKRDGESVDLFLNDFMTSLTSSGAYNNGFAKLEEMLKEKYEIDEVSEEFMAYTLGEVFKNHIPLKFIEDVLDARNYGILTNNITDELYGKGEKNQMRISSGHSEGSVRDIQRQEREGERGGRELTREGDGAYSDAEVSMENDPWSKAWGESIRTKRQQKQFAERERKRMRDRAKSLSSVLGIDIEVIEDASSLKGKKQRAKGWYDTKTRKITVVVGNHNSAADMEATILHEAVAHHGLRQLLGEHFDEFLDKVYEAAENGIKEQIDLLASRNGWKRRVATEEYLAGLAEDTDFEGAEGRHWGWFGKIKRLFIDMLFKAGFKHIKPGSIGDNELRYILWRSYQNLANPGRYRAFEWEAEDVVMQYQLQIGQYDTTSEKVESAADSGIRFRDGDFTPRDRKLAADVYEKMLSRGSWQFREATQDSMLGLKTLYESILGSNTRIEDVAGYENAYLYENRMSSANNGEQHQYFSRFMKPLLESIHKLCGSKELDRRILTDYMMAKHGLERNEYMRNEAAANGEDTKRDFAGLCGLTGEDDWQVAETVAQQMVDDYESDHDTVELWNNVKKATNATLEKIYLSSLISEDTYNKVLGMYDFYIPLRGWDETTSDEVYGYLTSKDGPFMGNVFKKAGGRNSKADDPIATIAMMADDAIRQGNRNIMKQRFLNFVHGNPSDLVSVNEMWLQHNDVTDEWEPVFADLQPDMTHAEVESEIAKFEAKMEALRTSEPDKYKKGRDARNIPYKVVRGNLNEHQVLVKRNGRTYVMTINGNPRAAQALNGLTNPDTDMGGVYGKMIKAASYINRHMSAFYTTRNPDFVVSNFMRDMLYANCMTWVKENPRYALRFHKNFGKVNPLTLHKLLSKWENDNLSDSNYLEKMFKEFMLNGGETGYTSVKDIDGHKRTIAKELKKISKRDVGHKTWYWLGGQLDLLNRSAENCARFAAFLTSREMGRTLDRSIHDAKEVSVNFNKKGSGDRFVDANGQTALGKIGGYLGGAGRSFYVFWNAGIQGMTNFGRAGVRNPKKAIGGAAALFTLGYVIPLLAQMLGGGDGDDDDKNAYYNLPEYVRRSNICFKAGGQWITIPLPIEYRAIYGMGELACGVISGNERYSNSELAYYMAAQISQVMPLDFLEGMNPTSYDSFNKESMIHPFVPSAFKPYTEAYIMNKGWTGLPIAKDSPFNKNEPEWKRVYQSTDQHLVEFSRWLNQTTGGNDYKKGIIDINPAKLEYLLSGTFGGMVSFPMKIKKGWIETPFGDRDFEWRTQPFFNRVIKSGDERTANRKLINEYFKYKDEAEKTEDEFKGFMKEGSQGILESARRADFLYNSPEFLRYQIFDNYDGDIQAMKKAIDMETDESIKKEMKEIYYTYMREAVKELRKADKKP